MKIIIVIPAWNEARHLGGVIDDLLVYYSAKSIIVVDDCSSDETGQIARNKGVIVVPHLINRGYGAALRTGTLAAIEQGADIIVHFDGDGQFLVSEIAEMVKPIQTGQSEVVLGSRFLTKISDIPFFKKWFIQRPAILIHRLLLGLPLTDTHNGFKAFGRAAAIKIFPNLQQERYAGATEVLQAIKQYHLVWAEVAVTVKYGEFGQGFGDGLKILKDLVWRFFIK
ncbi:MAG: glycosyltransferase family 2 protein [Candidatus Komeilibacteria bacterium]|nr:glycosyltransferase family 2 protein [Candidatus Komeilibacteria bacterium]